MGEAESGRDKGAVRNGCGAGCPEGPGSEVEGWLAAEV